MMTLWRTTVWAASVAAFMPAMTMTAQAPPPLPSSIDVSGAWVMTLEMPVGVAKPELLLVREGHDLSGTYSGRYGEFAIGGLVTGRVVTFSFEMGSDANPTTVCFTGEWVEETATLKGTATIGELGPATWTAARKPVDTPGE